MHSVVRRLSLGVTLGWLLVACLDVHSGSKSDGSASTQGGTSAGGDASVDAAGASTAATGNTLTPVSGMARFRLFGRFNTANPSAPSFSWQGSRIGVTFSGTSLSVMLGDTGSDGLDVVLDGNELAPLQLNPSTSAVTYSVAKNLAPGVHTAWLIKRTEPAQTASDGNTIATGTITLFDMGVDANGVFYTPPAIKTRRIEAIGDSSFTGYGVDIVCGNDASQPNNSCSALPNRYSPRTQDIIKSIPGQTAQTLGADLTSIGYSGEGVIYSYYDSGSCDMSKSIAQHCLPTLWQEVLPPAASPNYDFSQPVDVVLMSAGGDDLNASGTIPAGEAAFVSGMSNWLGQIRARYPKASIFVTLSPAAANADITTLGAALQASVAAAQKAQPGGADANMVYFNYYTGTNYTTYADIASSLNLFYGGYGHPSAAGSTWLGQRLAAAVASHMGWSTPVSP